MFFAVRASLSHFEGKIHFFNLTLIKTSTEYSEAATVNLETRPEVYSSSWGNQLGVTYLG